MNNALHLNMTGWCPADSELHRLVTVLESQGHSHPILSSTKNSIIERLSNGDVSDLHSFEQELNSLRQFFPSVVSHDQKLVGENAESSQKLPRVIGKYKLLRLVGSDSSGVHYDAIQTPLERRVRIRSLVFPEARTIEKAKNVARLEHSNIEFGIDCDKVRSSWFLVTQPEFGLTLEQVIQQSSKSISDPRIIQWMIQLTDAVIEFHKSDIAHLNIRPCNILIAECGEVVLCNPNLNGQFEDALTECGKAADGQIPFPHRIVLGQRSRENVLQKIDIVSAGLVLFQLVTGLPLDGFYGCEPLPFEGRRLKAVVEDHLRSAKCEERIKKLCAEAIDVNVIGRAKFDLRQFSSRLTAIAKSYS